jgi:hypothetical protein
MIRTLLTDLEEILLTIKDINKVSHGRAESLQQETEFVAVYIQPQADVFEPHHIGKADIASYNNDIFVSLVVNIDTDGDDLYWVDIRKKIINTILEDSPIWKTVFNRDVISVTHDDYDNYPKRSLEIMFKFSIRDTTVCT